MINNEEVKKLLDQMHEGIYFLDNNNVITFWNKAAEKISGFSAEEVIGSSCSENILTHVDALGNQLCITGCPLRDCIRDGVVIAADVFMHHKEGYVVPVAVKVDRLYNTEGDVVGGIEMFVEITDKGVGMAKGANIENTSQLDEVTRLASKSYIYDEVSLRISDFNRSGYIFGLLVFEIDGFDLFCKKYDKITQDKLLKMVAGTVFSSSRIFDEYGRVEGGKFVGVLHDLNLQQLEKEAEKLRMLIENSYLMLDNEKISVTISVAGSVPISGDTSESICQRVESHLHDRPGCTGNSVYIG